jgi:type II secretory pathway component GspD/PulD (secretin)
MKHLLLLSLLLTASCHSMGADHREREDSPEVFQVVPLKYAAAPELAEIVNDLEGTCPLHPGPPKAYRHDSKAHRGPFCAADPRTNSLIVRGAQEDLPQVLELITRLDTQVH